MFFLDQCYEIVLELFGKRGRSSVLASLRSQHSSKVISEEHETPSTVLLVNEELE
jgi:hypothetical protein